MADASSSDSQGCILSRRDGTVAIVTLSHPGRLNAITVAMWRELSAVVTRLGTQEGLRAIIVEGAGGNFAAGADIREFPKERADLDSVFRYHEEILAPALHALAHCPVPTIAAIEGVCVGGGLEIACSCDLRIAGRSATFGAPINRLGFPMAPEELSTILRVANRTVALELLLEGRVIPASDAAAKGLLTRIVEDGTAFDQAWQSAKAIGRGAVLAARWNKASLNRLCPVAEPMSREERLAFYTAWAESADHREGVRAFLEKRPPEFS
ncbi:MAG TPA: enoyl-CoA hydratase/isomerase family protein [Chthoniobacteraceae bacterium]|nr:enoyl-CoA hydratase/isomerase family protein [Chthoniobacteraceae bacterium]